MEGPGQAFSREDEGTGDIFGTYLPSCYACPNFLLSRVENQEIHHSERSFQEEFLAILDINGVTYDWDFIWE
jgi:hypothetical protein